MGLQPPPPIYVRPGKWHSPRGWTGETMGEIGIFLALNPGFRAAGDPERPSSFSFYQAGLSSDVLIFKGFVTVLLCNPQLPFCSKLFPLTDL